MNETLHNMMRGLSLHYLNKGTLEDAIESGRDARLPSDLLECLPGMMFEITSAACTIAGGYRTFDDVADELMGRVLASGKAEDFSSSDATAMLRITLDCIESLGCAEDALPGLTVPWYLYGQQAD